MFQLGRKNMQEKLEEAAAEQAKETIKKKIKQELMDQMKGKADPRSPAESTDMSQAESKEFEKVSPVIVLSYQTLMIKTLTDTFHFNEAREFEKILRMCYEKFSGKSSIGVALKELTVWMSKNLNVHIAFKERNLLEWEFKRLEFTPKITRVHHKTADSIILGNLAEKTDDFCEGLLKKTTFGFRSKVTVLKKACARLIHVILGHIYAYSLTYMDEESAMRQRINQLGLVIEFIQQLGDPHKFARIQESKKGSFTVYLDLVQKRISLAMKTIEENCKPKLKVIPWLDHYKDHAEVIVRNMPAYIHSLLHDDRITSGINLDLMQIFELYLAVIRSQEADGVKAKICGERFAEIQRSILSVQSKALKAGMILSVKNLRSSVDSGVISLSEAALYLDYVLKEKKRDILKMPKESNWLLNPDQFLRELLYYPEVQLLPFDHSPIPLLDFYTKDEYGLAQLRQDALRPSNLLGREKELKMDEAEFISLMQAVINPVLIDFSLPEGSVKGKHNVLKDWQPGIFKHIPITYKNHTISIRRANYFNLIRELITVGAELSVYLWFIKAIRKIAETGGTAFTAAVYQEILKTLSERTLQGPLSVIINAFDQEKSVDFAPLSLLDDRDNSDPIINWRSNRATMSLRDFYRDMKLSVRSLAAYCHNIDTYINNSLAQKALDDWEVMDAKLSRVPLLMREKLPGMVSHLVEVSKFSRELRSFIGRFLNPRSLSLLPQIEGFVEHVPVGREEKSEVDSLTSGDSFYHAVRGKWDKEKQMYVCERYQLEKDKEKVSDFFVCDSKGTPQSIQLISSGIWEHIIFGMGLDGVSGHCDHLLEKYQQFILKKCQSVDEMNWVRLKKVVIKFPQAMRFFYSSIKSKDKRDLSAKMFFHELYLERRNLSHIIYRNEELYQAFVDYHAVYKDKFTFPIFPQLKYEYSSYLQSEKANFLPADLRLIAHILSITVIHEDSVTGWINEINPHEHETASIQLADSSSFRVSPQKDKRTRYELGSPLVQRQLLFGAAEDVAQAPILTINHIKKELFDKEILSKIFSLIEVCPVPFVWMNTSDFDSYQIYALQLKQPYYKRRIAENLLGNFIQFLSHEYIKKQSYKEIRDENAEFLNKYKAVFILICQLCEKDSEKEYAQLHRYVSTQTPSVWLKHLSEIKRSLEVDVFGELEDPLVIKIAHIQALGSMSLFHPFAKTLLKVSGVGGWAYAYEDLLLYLQPLKNNSARDGIVYWLCLQNSVISKYELQAERRYFALQLIDNIIENLKSDGTVLSQSRQILLKQRLERIMLTHISDNADLLVTRFSVIDLLYRWFGLAVCFDSLTKRYVKVSGEDSVALKVSVDMADYILQLINHLYMADMTIRKLPKQVAQVSELEQVAKALHRQEFQRITRNALSLSVCIHSEVVVESDEDIPVYGERIVRGVRTLSPV
jgi:hypothetical protein